VARSVGSKNLEILGAKEALRALNSIDKKARRQVTKDYAQIVSTVVQEARSSTPTEPPLSGMQYRWNARRVSGIFPWNNTKSDRAIKPFVSGKKPRQYGAFVSDLATFGIKWTSADALVVEMAGRGPVPTAKGKQMVSALNSKYGTPGRFLWKAYLAHQDTVEREVELLIRDVMRRVQKEI
jgi:hypothetical protein